jgi:hypothetical protein
MSSFRFAALAVALAVLAWFAGSVVTAARAQRALGAFVTIEGLGHLGNTNPLPFDAAGNPYIPVQTPTDGRQTSFDAEMWQQHGELMSLLMDSKTLPKQVTVCGRKLSMIQGALAPSQTDESTYFPLTVAGTGLNVPVEGCFSITPVAYLRIKGIMTMSRAQLPQVVVVARY